MTGQPLEPAVIVAALLREHRFLSKGARDCKCGWSGGQMWPTTPHEDHLGQVIADALAAALAAAETRHIKMTRHDERLVKAERRRANAAEAALAAAQERGRGLLSDSVVSVMARAAAEVLWIEPGIAELAAMRPAVTAAVRAALAGEGAAEPAPCTLCGATQPHDHVSERDALLGTYAGQASRADRMQTMTARELADAGLLDPDQPVPPSEGAADQPQRDRFRIGCCYGNCDNSVSGQAGDPVLDGWIFDGRTWTCPLHHEGAADQPQEDR